METYVEIFYFDYRFINMNFDLISTQYFDAMLLKSMNIQNY